jgi:aspartyl-tRNA(Asn)/glutamyl-tRNA(Gln) amidotransferase subunit A
LAPSLDHVGPITRTVLDAALLLDAMTGTPAEGAPASEPGDLRGTTVGIPTAYFFERVDPGVRAAVHAALDRLTEAGATVREVDIGDLRAMVDAVFLRVRAEAQEVHRATFPSRRADYGADLVENLGRPAPTDDEWEAAERTIRTGVSALLAAVGDVDVLATPTTPATAPSIGADRVVVGGSDLHIEEMLTGFTSAFNAAGLPALTVPCGLVDGLPAGLQLVGRAGGEPALLRVGAAYEAVRGPAPRPSSGGCGRAVEGVRRGTNGPGRGW